MLVLFEVMDEDHSGDVNYKEFVDQLHRLRSPSTQTVILELCKARQKVQEHFYFHKETHSNSRSNLLEGENEGFGTPQGEDPAPELTISRQTTTGSELPATTERQRG